MLSKKLIGVGSFAIIFFFLPSLAVKVWEGVLYMPWQLKRWGVYPALALLGWWSVRRRLRRAGRSGAGDTGSLLFLAKQRLVKGEISLEEFRAIRQELNIE
jgi:hypothetical protein